MEERDKEKIDFLKQDYETVLMNEEQLHRMRDAMEKGREEKRGMKKIKYIRNTGLVAAAALVLVALPNTSAKIAEAMGNMPVFGGVFQAVTFREYHYEDEKHLADVSVSKLETVSEGKAVEATKNTVDEINAEIEKYTERYIRQFKADMKKDGYQSLQIRSENISESDRYFVLKLTAVQTEADSYEVSRFYTIDLNTGKRIALADLFAKDSDYIGVISENIKAQMREQMKSSEDVDYMIDSEDFPEDDFKSIKEDTNFYVNDKNEVVICFDQGDVAPMYMGSVEFVIPSEVLKNIRVN